MEEENKGGGREWRMGCQMGVINRERWWRKEEERDRKVSLIAPKYFLVGGRTVQGEVRGKVKVKQRLEER